MDAPFSLFLYKRFLEVMIIGNKKKGEISVEQFFSPQELQNLNTMDAAEQQKVIRNFRMHINSYLDHSYWFARFLRALHQGNSYVLGLLDDNKNIQQNPKNIRITLYHYNFSSPIQKKNGYWWAKEPLEQFSLDINL